MESNKKKASSAVVDTTFRRSLDTKFRRSLGFLLKDLDYYATTNCPFCYYQMPVSSVREITVAKLGTMLVCNNCLLHIHDDCDSMGCEMCLFVELHEWKVPEPNDKSDLYVPCALWFQEHHKRSLMIRDAHQRTLDKAFVAAYYKKATYATIFSLKQLHVFPKDIIHMIARCVYDSYTK